MGARGQDGSPTYTTLRRLQFTLQDTFNAGLDQQKVIYCLVMEVLGSFFLYLPCSAATVHVKPMNPTFTLQLDVAIGLFVARILVMGFTIFIRVFAF